MLNSLFKKAVLIEYKQRAKMRCMKHNSNALALINALAHTLQAAYQDPVLCQQYARWTVEYVTQKTTAELIAQPTITLTQEQHSTIDQWIKKMVDEHMPIQYLIGSVPFCDLEIIVEPPVLIPRPETEQWCSELIAELKKLPPTPLRILDMCSGSGCIVLALAHALPHASVIGADIGESALLLSRQNAKHNNITNASFVQSDLFAALPHNKPFDLIVSNPPYIAQKEWHTLDASVTTWEDKRALIAQHEGLAIIERIIEYAPHFLKKTAFAQHHNIPHLVLEIGHTQADAVTALLQHPSYQQVTVHKDLENKNRTVRARVSDVATAKNS